MPFELRSARSRIVVDWAIAVATQGSTLLLAELLFRYLSLTRLSLLFLAAVTIAASLRGRRAAVCAALVGVVFYKLFLDFRTGESTGLEEDVLNLAVFLVVALVAGTLAGQLHDEASSSRRRAKQMEALLNVSQISADPLGYRFWHAVVQALASATNGQAYVLDRAGKTIVSASEVELEPSAKLMVSKMMAEKGAPIRSGENWAACPIVTGESSHATLVWRSENDDAELRQVVSLLADLAAEAIGRTERAREQALANAAAEAAQLRETLLTSISHDFRSPLTAIIGSATSLLEFGDHFDEVTRRDLLLNINDEGERLNQFVTNLLSITRLQSGAIRPHTVAVQPRELLQDAIRRVERHRKLEFCATILGSCTAAADPVLLSQCFYNIIDNAAKYASPSNSLDIRTQSMGGYCRIEIADGGPGLPEKDQESIFSSFYLGANGKDLGGTGLGLAIVRGLVESMGGSVSAQNRLDGHSGLRVVVELPEKS